MKVVVLTSETVSNVWLVNQLLLRHDVAGMVIERRPPAATAVEKQSRRRRMIERYGRLRTINKLLFNRFKERVIAARDEREVRDSFFPAVPIAYARNVDTLTVENINDAACIDFIRALNPDALAVCGTTVLKPSVFTLTPKGTINIHTGITPEYRSADPIFWALYHGDPDKVGVTIHYVDKGIDTGSIIYQDSVPVYSDDSLATISVRCIRRGAELYSQALADIETGSVRTITKAGAASRAFLSIDLGLIQYLLFRWRFWRLAARLPHRDDRARSTVAETSR